MATTSNKELLESIIEESIRNDRQILYRPGEVCVVKLSAERVQLSGPCFSCFGSGRLFLFGESKSCLRCNGSGWYTYIKNM